METGFLAFVLHAHLPFVRHPESDRYLEERWLFEAITETYLPLLAVFNQLVEDRVDFRVTMSWSPTLLAMLTDELLQERYTDHLNKMIELAEREQERTKSEPEQQKLSRMYLERLMDLRQLYLSCDRNITKPFRTLQDCGVLELITASATHAILPYIKTREALEAQIETAAVEYERHFGRRPAGMWLPECAYSPGIDEALAKAGFTYFFVDTHGLDHAQPRPLHGVYAPIVTDAGTAVFARDKESSQQVWSSAEGYPGDHNYREYYRDVGYDLDFNYIRPYIHPDGIRVNTGLKYYRITGSEPKELYNPEWASESAGMHANHFIAGRIRQIDSLREWMDRPPIIVAPYDAELFGHWWYEGPLWIDYVCRQIHFDQSAIRMITPSEYIRQFPALQQCRMGMSTWGREGYADVWLQGDNAWIYPALHEAEERMIELSSREATISDEERERALNQAARELMLAQASDWAFIMDSKTMVEYAVKRTKWHVNRFTKLYRMIMEHIPFDSHWLEEIERRDNVFPLIDYRAYQRRSQSLPSELSEQHDKGRTIVMLSWEFPPMMVGGLSRHVFDLSRFLVRRGDEVHVVTCEVGGYPLDEMVEGVHVHRVVVPQPSGSEFIEWIYQLNLSMIERVLALWQSGLRIDLLHAHDWLVAHAAKEIKLTTNIPLVATIHATEHGRNHGIHNELQHRIHETEWMLTFEAWRVICCSEAMFGELQSLFQLPAGKLDTIPNGVDIEALRAEIPEGWRDQFALPDEAIVFFVGRLVTEKGVQILVQAAPHILSSCPNTKFVIAGRGPMMGELGQLTHQLGIDDKVHFAGFVDDETRNRLFALSSAAVFPSLYEPFGIVALEAMAAGSPVIVADVGGMSEIVSHDDNGLKVYPGDVQSLARQLIRILSEPALADRLVLRAGETVEAKYGWDRIAAMTQRVYERILSERGGLTAARLATVPAVVGDGDDFINQGVHKL